MIGIIDYRAGNLTSVKRALDYLTIPSIITYDAEKLIDCERLIFPGVGAAGKAMQDLADLGLVSLIKDAYSQGKPILGICLGTQIILTSSEEDNATCLDLIPGKVKRFPQNNLKVPHMGWNSIQIQQNHPVLKDIPDRAQFYFVHSYYPEPDDHSCVIALTEYGIYFPSIIAKRNLIAVQFHPEKSAKYGLKLLKNFASWDGSC